MSSHDVRHGPLLLAGALCLLAPLGLSGQEQQAAGAQNQARTEPPNLVIEREVFEYPTYGRRNPFRALVGADQGGPRFEQLRVEGIVYNKNDPAESVVALGTSVATESADGTSVSFKAGQAWYLKAGQTLGNIRIVAVHADQVVVDVEEFKLTTRKTMQIQTRRLGGGTP